MKLSNGRKRVQVRVKCTRVTNVDGTTWSYELQTGRYPSGETAAKFSLFAPGGVFEHNKRYRISVEGA